MDVGKYLFLLLILIMSRLAVTKRYLRHIAEEAGVNWLLITGMLIAASYQDSQIQKHEQEIVTVTEMYGFADVHGLKFPPASLKTLAIGEIVQTRIVYTVYRNKDYIQRKFDILDVLESKMGELPFPRSYKALEALSHARGVQSDCKSAEAFLLLKGIVQ